MPLMIINALNGRALPVYGDGLNVRDWLYVEDHCRAIDAILKSGRSGETYNVGGNCERSNRQVLAALCAAIDQRFNESPALRQRFPQALAAAGKQTAAAIKFVQDRPGHDRRYAIDATKITSELKFSPASDFEQSIGRTVDWYLANSAWWLEILRREGQKNHHWLPEAAIQH
jgi:dTDP-glucose 4,6-dehydratase